MQANAYTRSVPIGTLNRGYGGILKYEENVESLRDEMLSIRLGLCSKIGVALLHSVNHDHCSPCNYSVPIFDDIHRVWTALFLQLGADVVLGFRDLLASAN